MESSFNNSQIDKSKINQKGNISMNNNEESEKSLPTILVELSDDYYEAYLTIKCDNTQCLLDKDMIYKILEEKNITYGLDYNTIDLIINECKSVDRVKIAQGKKHQNGKDGKIIFNFHDDSQFKPQKLDNGKVDHKNLNFVNQINKGDILAEKSLPTLGINGITVTGKTIKAKPGKNINFKIGKNVKISDDGLKLIADEVGIVKIEYDDRISIIKVLEINQDVGVSTGNIKFDGKIIINGNVNSGYKVIGGEDVIINGVVEGAEIIAKGNIYIKKGIYNRAVVMAHENIECKFMESSRVSSQKNIKCDVIMHCDVNSQGTIMANIKKGLIVGGIIQAKKEIIAYAIGSQIGTITKLRLGINENFLEELNNIKKIYTETKNNMKKLNQAIDILNKQYKNDPNNTQLKTILDKTEKTKQQYNEEANKLESKINNMYETLKASCDCKIISNVFYPGVKIRINNSHYNIKKILKKTALVLENGEIRATNP